MRQKKTEICQTCAKIKNVCQTCILDLDYNLPVQVRDSVLKVKDCLPVGEQNRNYFIANAANTLKDDETLTNYDKADEASKQKIKAMARWEPYYKRNMAHVCTMYVKGQCTRGETCPYRHELPQSTLKGADGLNAKQNIKDRFYGRQDPVAKKILQKAKSSASVLKNDNTDVTGIYLTGIKDEKLEEADFVTYFSKFGTIKRVNLVKRAGSVFVYFNSRADAEAAFPSSNAITLKGQVLQVSWVKKA